MAEPGYIQTDAGPLFRVLDRPEGAGRARAAVLFLAPCGDEKRAAYGASARLAGHLAAAGAAVLRFDYFGTGDSAGESQEVSLATMRRDAAAAAAALGELVPGATLEVLGVRMGGSLALELGAGLGAAKTVAVAPVVSGHNWLRQERGRRQLRRSMVKRELGARGRKAPASGEEALPSGAAEDMDGLLFSAGFISEMEAYDLTGGEAPESAPDALIVQVSPRRTPLPEVERAAKRFGARVRPMHIEPFWQPLESPALTVLAECLTEFLLEPAP